MVLYSSTKKLETKDQFYRMKLLQKNMQNRMKLYRMQNNVTAKEVEEVFGSWYRVEYDSRNLPNLLTLFKVAEIIGITVQELISPLPSE